MLSLSNGKISNLYFDFLDKDNPVSLAISKPFILDQSSTIDTWRLVLRILSQFAVVGNNKSLMGDSYLDTKCAQIKAKSFRSLHTNKYVYLIPS
jgi:hypothetical protein